MNNNPSAPPPDLRRLRLPELILLADLVAASLFVSISGARRAVLRGDLGPYTKLGRRLVLRRDSLLEALEAREVRPRDPPSALPPRDPELVRRILHPRGGGSR